MSLKSFILQLASSAKAEEEETYVPKGNVKSKKEVERIRPDRDTDLYWDIYRTGAIEGAGVDFTISFVLGNGMEVIVHEEDGTIVDPTDASISEFYRVIRRSKPRSVMTSYLKDRFVTGDGYIEKIASSDKAKIMRFGVVPSNNMTIEYDGVGTIKQYVQELGESEAKYPKFLPEMIVHTRNRSIAGEMYGRSDIEPITEVSEILRDMIIDLSNFINTKAYPPLIWKLGTDVKPWGKTDIDAWSLDRADVEPGDQISVRGDVTGEAIGVADAALDVEPYLTFFASLIVSGLRIPATLTSVIPNIGQFTADSQTNAYTRKINDIRAELSEQLEVELFDYILHYNGYGENRYTEVVWKKHDDESIRMAVNNVVMLVQNGIMSLEEARDELLLSPSLEGTFMKAVDKPEGASPSVPPESDQQNMNQTSDDDGREDEVRKTATNRT